MKTSIRELLISAAIAAPLIAGGVAHGAVFPSSPGQYTFPDGSKGFALLTQGGVVNPEVLVGFNPQPDPPGGGLTPTTTLDLTDPLHPSLNNTSTDGPFIVELALLGVGDGTIPLPAAPGDGGRTTTRQLIDGEEFAFTFFTGPGLVDQASWGAFNPQPDPPGDVLGLSYAFEGRIDPNFTLYITEDGQALSFSPATAPEPATWAMLIAGFGAAGAMLRRTRRQLAPI
jgi:hypothetical protein